MSRSSKLVCGAVAFDIPKSQLIDLDTFNRDPGLLVGEYVVKSDVTAGVFCTFIEAISGKCVHVTRDNYKELEMLSSELGYHGLDDDIRELRETVADTNVDTYARKKIILLEKTITQLQNELTSFRTLEERVRIIEMRTLTMQMPVFTPEVKAKIDRRETEFKLDEDLFDGILANITGRDTTAVTKGVIGVTTSSTFFAPGNVVDLLSSECFYSTRPSGDNPGQWICLDFLTSKVEASHYTLRRGECLYIKSWVVEVSDEGEEWTVIHERENSDKLCGCRGIATFAVSTKSRGRFVRLRQTAANHANNHSLEISAFELFGEIDDGRGIRNYVMMMDPLKGIISALTLKCNGNVSEKGVVAVTAKASYEGKNIVNSHDLDSYFASINAKDQWICLDLKDKRVKLTG